MKNLMILVIFSVLLPSTGMTQVKENKVESNRKIGLSAMLLSGQFDIILPLWLSDYFVLAPVLGFIHASGVSTDYRLGIIPRIYFKNETIAPFVGGRFVMISNYPANEGLETTDYVFGIGFGADYFLIQHFSFGIEAQVNFSKSNPNSNRFGNPGKINFNTATALIATVYF